MIDIDPQGMTAGEYEELICDVCNNSPLHYYCPACDYKACSDCLHDAFRVMKDGTIICKRCGHIDKKLDTFVGR